MSGKAFAAAREVLGAMALRSRKYSGELDVRFADLKALVMRSAVAVESRGGTMERM